KRTSRDRSIRRARRSFSWVESSSGKLSSSPVTRRTSVAQVGVRVDARELPLHVVDGPVHARLAPQAGAALIDGQVATAALAHAVLPGEEDSLARQRAAGARLHDALLHQQRDVVTTVSDVEVAEELARAQLPDLKLAFVVTQA